MVTKVGCEAYIRRGNQLLLGKRGNVYGQGTWALPGGHLEFLERADACLIRELKEEMGIAVASEHLELLALSDDLQPEQNIHYLHITFRVDIGDQEPHLMEPDACEAWQWFDIESLPENIFPPHAKIFTTLKSKRVYI